MLIQELLKLSEATRSVNTKVYTAFSKAIDRAYKQDLKYDSAAGKAARTLLKSLDNVQKFGKAYEAFSKADIDPFTNVMNDVFSDLKINSFEELEELAFGKRVASDD